jgi:hypothetical protein
VVVLAAVCAAVVTSCGGGGGGATDSKRAERRIEPAAQARAEASNLTLEDFETGWRAEKADENDSSTCASRDLSHLTIVGTADSPTFRRGNITSVQSSVTIFDSEADATESFDAVRDPAFEDCFVDVITNAIDDTDGVDVTDSSVGALSFPHSGDETEAFEAAIEVKAEGQSVSVYVDVVAVRKGDAIALLAFGDALSPFDDSTKEELVAQVVEKIGS